MCAAMQGQVQLQHTLLEKLGIQTGPTVCVCVCVCVCACVCVCVCSLSASSVALKSEIAASPLLAKVRRQLGWAEGILELPAPRTQSSTTQPLCPQQSQLCHVLPGTGPQHAAGFHSLQGSWTG